jgi:hypothetical protein
VVGAFAFGVAIVVLASLLRMRRGGGAVDLGVADAYAPNSVVYRSTDAMLVVRLPDGRVVAYSDVDPHNSPGRSSCLVTFRPDLSQGGEPGRFFDICTGSMYDLTGHGLAGDGLDLRPVRVEQDEQGRLTAFPRG